MKKQTAGEALSRAVQDYIRNHSTERFSLPDMAGALFVNGSYLLRTFKSQTGITPLRFHYQVRCMKAKELLSQTDMSICDIGEAIGFATPSHFSHVFRKVTGFTPGEYRRMNRRTAEGDIAHE